MIELGYYIGPNVGLMKPLLHIDFDENTIVRL